MDKLDYEGFLSPLVLERYAQYMHSHRVQATGVLRDSDNWQKGIPLSVYMKSGYRHFFDWWKHHRKLTVAESVEESLCALLFNVMGYLHVVIRIDRYRAHGTAAPDHSSETALDDYKGFDAIILNGGDVTDLKENVEEVVRYEFD